MLCPNCGADATRVIDSRPVEAGAAIRRRRVCEVCAHRYTTYERAEPQLVVRKRSGRLEAFSPMKLASGMSAALADRPLTGSDVQDLVAEVEETIRGFGSEVTSEEIGHEVLEKLKAVDEVAYLRFASVYKEFQDATDFEKEMAALESAEQL